MTDKYISIHNHTEFSNIKIIDSINRAERLINYAYELGLSGLAITEHDCVSGTLKSLKAYRKKLESEWRNLNPEEEELPSYQQMADELNFKFILGNEIYLSEEGLTEAEMDGKHPAHFWHLILLAKDAEGFKQIRQLSSAAWRRSWFRAILRTPTYPSDLLEFVKGGHLICSTACLGGYPAWCWKMMTEALAQNDNDAVKFYVGKLDNHLAAMNQLFGSGNFFVELQPNENGSEQNEYNKFMINRYWGYYPFIFSTDSHYLKVEEREIHKAFLNSKESKGNREVDSFYKYAYMMSQEEVWERMKEYITAEQFEEMVSNTKKIGAMCSYYDLEQPKVIAKVNYEHMEEYAEDLELFADVNEEEYPNFYYYIHSDVEADRYLAELIAHGYAHKWEPSWDQEVYYKRLEEELWTFKTISDNIQRHMSDYFITMHKMVDLMWQAGSLVGPSRGSAGVVLINYLLDITQMNPIKMDLPFVWRFMHPSRPDYPDIDVDTESGKRAAVFDLVRDYFRSLGGDVINVCTFGTEGTKSAIKTAARGLNVDENIVAYLNSMIPNERGFDWPLSDCYYGNEKEGRAPIKAFVETMNANPMLWELAQNIEGLVTRLGVHASGVIAVNGDFIEHGSYMKTSKEQLVTAYDLHDQEECGLLKYDFLTVSALDRIHQCMNYLLEDGTIEWQGDLKSTYKKYLSPDVLDYDNPEMWDMVGKGLISSLFQFDTIVGSQAIKDIQPRSLNELAISSSLMRLMSDGELPLAKYARFKRVPELWYDEMRSNGLTDEEIKILEKYLKKKNGVGESQEVVMQMVMDEHISGFSMKEANKLRKTIAKKNFREIDAVRDLFFEKGQALGTSRSLLNYVWFVQISAQLGYSFSEIHTTGYALIALIEMNLAYRYPIIYWNCACLSVDSSAVSEQDFENLIEDDVITIDDDDDSKKKTQNKMDYSKIAAGLDRYKNICNIHLPDINKSKLSFTPNVETNSILYGLKGICKVTEPVISEIMNNRPFSSLEDFLNRVTKRVVTKDKVINLIKCGAFDEIEGKDRSEILKDFIWTVCEPKKRITLQNLNMLIDLELLPNSLDYVSDVYKLTKELRKHRDAEKMWYFGDNINIPENKINVWRGIFKDSGIMPETIEYEGETRGVFNSDKWDRFYEKQMDIVRAYIKPHAEELLIKLNNKLFENEFNKYCSGDKLQWELDSINFYFDGHPLNKVIPEINEVVIDRVEDIVEGAQDGEFVIKGNIIPRMKLFTIAGTVLDRDTTKGLVTIQCPDGVVNVKVYKDLFALYNKTITDESGEKIIDESFFDKGQHLLITGIQRGMTFVPKVYKNTGRKSIERILLDEDGNFIKFIEKME